LDRNAFHSVKICPSTEGKGKRASKGGTQEEQNDEIGARSVRVLNPSRNPGKKDGAIKSRKRRRAEVIKSGT